MTPFAFSPLADRVLVRPILESETMRGSLHLPMTTGDARGFAAHLDGALLRGEVVACGPGDLLYPKKDGSYAYLHPDGSRYAMQVKPGDIVLYPHRGGESIQIDGRDYVVLHEEQSVMAVIE